MHPPLANGVVLVGRKVTVLVSPEALAVGVLRLDS
jgi:hypothetical protein